jgi:hypothetical protein
MAQALYDENISQSEFEEDEIEPYKTRAKRGKGRMYEPWVSIENSDAAITQLKSQFAGAYWKRTVTSGTTDKRKVFHPFGLALSINEKAEDFAFLFGAIKDAVL